MLVFTTLPKDRASVGLEVGAGRERYFPLGYYLPQQAPRYRVDGVNFDSPFIE